MSNVTELVPNKSDFDVAKELKEKMMEASKAACAILDEAISLGLNMQVQFGPNAFGKMVIVSLQVSKIL